IHGDLLYVLNAGGAVGDVDGIAGFRIGKWGSLDPLGGSVRPLSQDSTQPAQIGFSPDGQVLAVTEKATNKVDTFAVDGDGYADGPFVHDAPGQTPFGFAFGKRGRLFVTEAFPGQMDAAAVSVYAAGSGGSLDVLSASVPTTETAACWIAVTSGARYAYTANTPNATLTGFAIGSGGSLSLLSSDGVSAMTGMGSAPVDLAVSGDDRFLYSLNSGSHSIGAFAIGPDGSLAPLGVMGGLPASANGLAAR
ncbi:MAG TPA: beta-propeller fold lactonase family protein, partial [Candidatus Saccharimonadales bacterium]|nr:beta-propeller fold lactonase family protein [Candidatus Saccharimonadales bacterium]